MHVIINIYFKKQVLIVDLIITTSKYKQYFEIFTTTVGEIKITEIVLVIKVTDIDTIAVVWDLNI